MERKRWTPQTEVSEALLTFREKRKWQIALRRYLIEKQPSLQYAPYFGLDIENFREWISIQFTEDCNWQNFSQNWQLDHYIPLSYFDLGIENERILAWNFTNIRLSLVKSVNTPDQIGLLAAKSYFNQLFTATGYYISKLMVEKIEELERMKDPKIQVYTKFIIERTAYLSIIETFTAEEFKLINTGTSVANILAEAEARRKLGLME